MIKFISVIHHPPGSDVAKIRDYWFNEHAKFVRANLKGLRKYVINLPVPPEDGSKPLVDGIVELHFDDMASAKAALGSPAWQSDERKARSANVIDYSNFLAVQTEEHVVPLD